ncbi:hypothetical protein GCM10027612_78340 [Microbispora bryophytorum subsp. camponoti]
MSAARVPVCPIAPTAHGWSYGTAPLPAWVSATGTPWRRAKRASSAQAPLYLTPPPATISGRREPRSSPAALARAAGSGTGRATCQTLRENSSSGQSYASACTSCGSASVTAPVSAGSVSTRMAPSSAAGSCSGRLTRSQKRLTGLRQSLTLTSYDRGSSSSCSTGEETRVANRSPGSSSTGSRSIVASAAPVTMLVAPGPIELVQASVDSRSDCRA